MICNVIIIAREILWAQTRKNFAIVYVCTRNSEYTVCSLWQTVYSLAEEEFPRNLLSQWFHVVWYSIRELLEL